MKLRMIAGHTVHGDEIIDYVEWPADVAMPPGSYTVLIESMADFDSLYGTVAVDYVDGTCREVVEAKRVSDTSVA